MPSNPAAFCLLCNSPSSPTAPIHIHSMMRCSRCCFVFAADRLFPTGFMTPHTQPTVSIGA